MEKIKLFNDTVFSLLENGINKHNNSLSIRFDTDNKSLDDIEKLFSNKENTKKINMLDSKDEVLEIYKNFTNIKSIVKELVSYVNENGETENKYVTSVTLEQGEVEDRLTALEQKVNAIINKLNIEV